MLAHSNSVETAVPVAETGRLAAALLAAILGAFFLFGAGFAQSDLLHNAAHDSRHASGFPCH